MEVARLIDLSLYAQLILIYLLFHNLRNSTSKEHSTKLFIGITIGILINNTLEASSWVISGIAEPWAYYLSYFIISSLLALNSVPAALWIRYIDYKIFRDYEKANKRFLYYLIPFYISTALIIINLFTGIVFTISPENIYSRSFGVYIITSLSIIMVATVFFLSRRYKKEIQGKILEAIFLFMLIPMIAGIIQILVFGIPLIWPAFTLATVIVFNLVEIDSFLKDPLTKLNTRGQFENRLKYMLKRGSSFSIIMVDLNYFKRINDKFGHKEGDEALISVSSIIDNSVKRYDTVCRYGGDEFMLMIESDKIKAGEKVVSRISESVETYNSKMIKPYKLSLSYGNVYVGAENTEGVKDILSKVDLLMYSDKEIRKKNGENVQRD